MISFRFRYFAVEAILQRWQIVFDLSPIWQRWTMGRDGDIAFESRPVRLRKTRDNARRSHSELRGRYVFKIPLLRRGEQHDPDNRTWREPALE